MNPKSTLATKATPQPPSPFTKGQQAIIKHGMASEPSPEVESPILCEKLGREANKESGMENLDEKLKRQQSAEQLADDLIRNVCSSYSKVEHEKFATCKAELATIIRERDELKDQCEKEQCTTKHICGAHLGAVEQEGMFFSSCPICQRNKANQERDALKRERDELLLYKSRVEGFSKQFQDKIDDLKRENRELKHKTSLEGFREMARQTAEALDERDSAISERNSFREMAEALDWIEKEHPDLKFSPWKRCWDVNGYTGHTLLKAIQQAQA